MKRSYYYLVIIWSFVIFTLTPSTANAQYDFQVGNLYYKVTSLETCSVVKPNPGSDPSTYSGNIVIPSSVKFGNRDLKVTEIDENAFVYSNITSLTIQGGVQIIGRHAFFCCRQLRNVNTGNDVTIIRQGAFYGCEKLEDLFLSRKLKSIEISAFENSRAPNDRIHIPASCTEIGEDAFNFKAYVSSNYSFYLDPGPTTLTLYKNAFNPIDRRLGKNIVIGRNLKLIYTYIYQFEEVIFMNGVTTMPECLGRYVCVRKLDIGKSITTVPSIDSSDLETIIIRNPTPPQAKEFPNSVYLNAVLYVPPGSLSQFQKADVWKNFWTIKEISEDD